MSIFVIFLVFFFFGKDIILQEKTVSIFVIFLVFLCWQRFHSAGEDCVKQGRKSSPRFFDALSTDGNGEILTIAHAI